LHNEEQLTLENSVLTCIHVMNNTEKYEYVPEDSKATESFTCSKCLDLTSEDSKAVMKFLLCVCRKCFLESRVRNS